MTESTAHICYACHLVRFCGGCCHTCKTKCNAIHDCEIHDRHMSPARGWEWFYNVTRAIDASIVRELKPDIIPKGIELQVRKMTNKPLQLKLDF